MQVAYKNKRINSAWSLLGNVTYLHKNCDKLYWTNWIETASCSLLRHWDYTRNCEDCDGNEVDEKHCDGNSTIQKIANRFGSEWIEGRLHCYWMQPNSLGASKDKEVLLWRW